MIYKTYSYDFPIVNKENPYDQKHSLDMNEPDTLYLEPFHILGRLYYAGTKFNGGFLIDSGDGLILLDAGNVDTAPLLIDSIWRLGFDPKNIKMIFHTHKHSDHLGATKVLKTISGAKTFMGAADAEALVARKEREGNHITRFVPDVYVNDGDEFTLGEVTIRCLATPGHSKGCMAFLFDLYDDEGKKYVVALPGDVCLNTVHTNYITQWDPYPDSWKDLFEWTERLKDLPVDITLGCHGFSHGHTIQKYEDMKANPDVNPFIDPTEWKRTLCDLHEQLKKNIKLEQEGRMWLDCSTARQKLYVSEDVTDEEVYLLD